MKDAMKDTTKTEAAVIPIILCAGKLGTAVVYGYVDQEPVHGSPVRLHRARMIIRWEGTGGLFGIAAIGPDPRSLVSVAVDTVVETLWQEWLSVTAEAAAVLDAWPVTP